jgi:hypothetical protein
MNQMLEQIYRRDTEDAEISQERNGNELAFIALLGIFRGVLQEALKHVGHSVGARFVARARNENHRVFVS